jgi:hypothetical protein
MNLKLEHTTLMLLILLFMQMVKLLNQNMKLMMELTHLQFFL